MNDLELLKESLPLLKVGVRNSDYPQYAQYIFSDGKTIQAFNSDIHVLIDASLEFVGALNYFVVSGILSKLNEFTYHSDATNLYIVDDKGYKYEIPIEQIPSPNIAQTDFEYTTLTHIDSELIKEASVITTPIVKKDVIGNRVYSYVMIRDGYVVATDRGRAFLGQLQTKNNSISVLDRNSVALIEEGVEIGTKNYFSSLKLGESIKILSTIDDMTLFPYIKLLKLFESSRDSYKPVCSLSVLIDVIKTITPVLFKEKMKVVSLHNKNNELEISGGSIVNGTITKTVPSDMEEGFRLNIDLNSLKGIKQDKFLCVNPGMLDRFYLSGDGSELIIRTYNG